MKKFIILTLLVTSVLATNAFAQRKIELGKPGEMIFYKVELAHGSWGHFFGNGGLLTPYSLLNDLEKGGIVRLVAERLTSMIPGDALITESKFKYGDCLPVGCRIVIYLDSNYQLWQMVWGPKGETGSFTPYEEQVQ